jgi:hypothetical protein
VPTGMMLNQMPSAKRQCRSPSIRSANSPHRSPTHSAARAVRGRRRTRFAKARRCSKPQRAAAAAIWRIQDGATVSLSTGGRSSPQLSLAFIASGCSAARFPTRLILNRGPSTQRHSTDTIHDSSDAPAAVDGYAPRQASEVRERRRRVFGACDDLWDRAVAKRSASYA